MALDKIVMYFLVSFSFNMLLMFFIVFFRNELRDGIKLRFMTRFYDFCKVRIYTKDKRIKNYIIHSDKEINEFKIDDKGIYTIDPEQAFFEGSIPTYIYSEDNHKPLNPFDIKASMVADPLLLDKVVLRAKASGRLAEWFKKVQLIIILLVVAGFLALLGAYFGFKLYKFFEPVLNSTLDKVLARYCIPIAQATAPGIVV
jgi:hypothetical protein